ncbi:hypothetical protein HK098_001254 [Nowakowskiella sp. JEL0407]|nr:hypothetical protein HK098_001254 [Nowakowskiella sp. JEL0407]
MFYPTRSKALRRYQFIATASISAVAVSVAVYYLWNHITNSKSSANKLESVDEKKNPVPLWKLFKKSNLKVVLTISVQKLILWNPSPDPLSPIYAFNENTLTILRNILASHIYTVYLIAVVSSDFEESQIHLLLTSPELGLVSSGLDKRKIIFCQTEEGKAYIVRHIGPMVHVDDCDFTLSMLVKFVPRLVRVHRSSGAGNEGEEERQPQITDGDDERKPKTPVFENHDGVDEKFDDEGESNVLKRAGSTSNLVSGGSIIRFRSENTQASSETQNQDLSDTHDEKVDLFRNCNNIIFVGSLSEICFL